MEPSPSHAQSQQNSASMFQPSSEHSDTQNFTFGLASNQMSTENINQINGTSANMLVTENTVLTIANNVSNPMSNQGQVSPVKKVVSPSESVTSPQNSNSDVPTLNEQIQLLYSMPQTPHTQQKILDLQETAQMLKSHQTQQSPRPSQQQTFQPIAAVKHQIASQSLPSPQHIQPTVVSMQIQELMPTQLFSG